MDALLTNFHDQLKKAQGHLAYSFHKVQKLKPVSDNSPEEELEVWESFASRFARASDILISKVLRRLILSKDPAFRGSVIDLLNQAEKFQWIESAHDFRRIGELGNVAAHEYAVNDLQSLYAELIRLTPLVLKVTIDDHTTI